MSAPYWVDMKKKLFIVFLLGFSSGLPLALLSSTLQAWFADDGMSVMATGMLSLIGFPYVYRVIWGPFQDRYSILPLGKRRSWILSMQVLLLIGFNLLAWLSPSASPRWMGCIAFLLAVFSATQDSVVDAQRVEYLPKTYHGLGASLGVFGYRVALFVSGGLALVLAQHLGWAVTYRVMGLLMVVGMLAILWSKEPDSPIPERESLSLALIAPASQLLCRPGFFTLVLFIIFYKLGEAFTTTTSGIVMPFLIQGIGFSLETIGYVNKVVGIASIVLGGLTAGFLLTRWSLFNALLGFGLFQAATNVLFIVLAYAGKNITLLTTTVIFDNFAAGMGSTALVALFMRLVDQRFTATQFSLLVAISTLPRILSGPVAATIQQTIGWTGLYQVAFFLALGFIPFLMRIRSYT